MVVDALSRKTTDVLASMQGYNVSSLLKLRTIDVRLGMDELTGIMATLQLRT